jgi:hypothetical protein
VVLFAGLVPGRLVGMARGASYLLAKTEDIAPRRASRRTI